MTDPIAKKAVTFRYVNEGGKHFVVISHGGPDDWVKYELNRHQVAGFTMDSLSKVLPR